MQSGRVVVLNGVGSVGKSSTARALQEITADPFLLVAMDQFIDMAPARLLGGDEGLRFERGEENGHLAVMISAGPALDRLMDGMRHAIAAMAARGNNLIVDDVFWNGEEGEYRRLLRDQQVEVVGLFAPLEVIEDRERARGDRIIGLARWQYPRVHRGVIYDLEVDMTDATPAQAAAVIQDSLDPRYGLKCAGVRHAPGGDVGTHAETRHSPASALGAGKRPHHVGSELAGSQPPDGRSSFAHLSSSAGRRSWSASAA